MTIFPHLTLSTILVSLLHCASASASASCPLTGLAAIAASSAAILERAELNKAVSEKASKCPKGIRRRVASTEMSNYGNGDGFAGKPTACGPLMNTKKLQVAVRCDIFKKLQVRGGKRVGKSAICGKQIAITWKGKTVLGQVLDCGGLRPNRELDVSPAVKKALNMPMGLSKVSYDICE